MITPRAVSTAMARLVASLTDIVRSFPCGSAGGRVRPGRSAVRGQRAVGDPPGVAVCQWHRDQLNVDDLERPHDVGLTEVPGSVERLGDLVDLLLGQLR